MFVSMSTWILALHDFCNVLFWHLNKEECYACIYFLQTVLFLLKYLSNISFVSRNASDLVYFFKEIFCILHCKQDNFELVWHHNTGCFSSRQYSVTFSDKSYPKQKHRANFFVFYRKIFFFKSLQLPCETKTGIFDYIFVFSLVILFRIYYKYE